MPPFEPPAPLLLALLLPLLDELELAPAVPPSPELPLLLDVDDAPVVEWDDVPSPQEMGIATNPMKPTPTTIRKTLARFMGSFDRDSTVTSRATLAK